MIIKFKKLCPKAKTPFRATEGSAGFDLTAVSVMMVGWEKTSKVCFKYSTGIAFEIPPGYVGLVFPRSSIVKTGAVLGNSVGVIDSDYRGEVTFVFKPEGMKPPYEPGDRIGQIVFVPVPAVELEQANDLSESARGSGGYGSTGR